MLGIIVVPRNAVMIQEREHLFAALLTPFLVFVRQWGGEFSLTHCRRNLIADRLCLRITTVMGCFDSALPAKRWFTTPKRHLLGLRIYKTYRHRNGQTMLPEWPSDDSSHSGGCWEEPGKQNPRSCRAQELARSRAQENERQKRKPTTSSTCEWRRGQSRVQEEVQCACNSHHTILSYIIFWKTERMAHTTKDKAKLLNRVRRIRGQVEAIERALDGEHEHALNWREVNRVLFVAAAAAAIWFLGGARNPYVTGIGVICAIVGGFPIFHEAYENIVQRRMTMELSMAIAIVAALAIREIFTALVITLFVLVAEILEGLTVGRGRTAIRHLVGLLPTTATVRRNESWQDVETKEIAVGDIVLVKPGTRIPVDGVVVGGHSFVDQATITGESMPAEKIRGTSVYAGTINQSGALEIQVDRMGRDTTFGKIIDAVERAEKSRAPIQGIADRLAGYLVYFALGAAALTFVITDNMRSTISVVIVAGACGIAAGTPLAILGGIGRSAQLGSIIKGGLYLESLATIDTILLDKTGTLTYGTPGVVDVRPADGVPVASLLQAAVTAESRSEHPVAKAILKKASNMGISGEEPERFDYTPGKGIVTACRGMEIIVGNRLLLEGHRVELPINTVSQTDSEILVAQEGKFLGTLVVADTLRDCVD